MRKKATIVNRAVPEFLVNICKDILIVDETTGNSQQQIALIPLLSPGNGSLGVAVNLSWIREMHYLLYWGERLYKWRQKYDAAEHVETQRDVEKLAIWPLVELTCPPKEVLQAVFEGCRKVSQSYTKAPKVSLSALQGGLHFKEGVETKIMQYPELVSLIDGATFRFPEAYFIAEMESITAGGMIHRNPDWFRTFDGLPVKWRGHPVCELCDSDSGVVRHIIGPSRIVRCRECGLEYDNPQAVIAPAALDKYASTLNDRRKNTGSMIRAEQNAEILIKGLEAIDPALLKQPLLDIGCASGELLYILRERYGWPNDCLWGVDPSGASVKIAQTRYRLNVLNTELPGNGFPANKFQIIVVFNTFEHLAKPRAALVQLNRFLAPGGCVLLATIPNVSCLLSASFPGGFIAKNFPDGQHHYHYTPETLTRLCNKEGFEVIRLDGETRESVLNKVKETATWLAFSCGVPLSLCKDEGRMLYELKSRLSQTQEKIVKEQGDAYRFNFHDDDFKSSETLIAFWRREIWPSPYLSDKFDLWLKKNAG